MKIEGWKYYNHAAIPTTAPHEPVNLEPIENGSIWKVGGGTPLLARWHSDWDCGYETNWWFIICDAPFSIDALSRKSRKNIRKSLENCKIMKINPKDWIDELWAVFQEATERYNNYTITTTKEGFSKVINNAPDSWEYWAGYDKETDRMIGYKVCAVYDEWVSFTVSKYSTKYLKLRVSDALNYTVLDYYLNDSRKRYVSNGERSIVHDTNVQDYYQEHFRFRKAYCKLRILYRFPLNVFIKMVFPFRDVLRRHANGKLHLLSSLLTMEELIRE